MNKRFQEILSLAQSGRLADALKQCDRAIKKKPKKVDFLLLGASLYAQSNQYEKVKEYCFRATQLDRNNTNALYNLGVACLFVQDYENAIKYTLPLIKLDKNNAKAHANLGLAYWHIGELDKAKEYALIADKLDPGIATNHNNLGLIYKSLKETDTAIIHFKKAIELDLQLAEAYYNCGITLLDINNEEGRNYLDKALLIKPEYPEANNYMGITLLENNQAAQAVDYFKKAIIHKPDYAEAYCNLGNAYTSQKEFFLAETMFRKAIEFNPAFANAYNNLGNSLLNQDTYKQHFPEAVKCYLQAIDLAPELNDTYKNMAVCYQAEGMNEEALHYYKIYNERVPNDDVVISNMATIHERDGNHDKAIALIKPLLKSADNSIEVTLAYANLARHFKHEEDAIQALTNINDGNIPVNLKTEKYYILGKLAESKCDADKTFYYYYQANELEENIHDHNKNKKLFHNIKSYFTKEKIKTLQRSKNTSSLPIFIVGMPRSGTSLAEQVLSSHPDVFGAGELENIERLTNKIRSELDIDNNYPLCLDNMTGDYATQLADEHVETLGQLAPEASYIVDKMPHNFLGLGEINLLFPEATVIHCKRSSIDTCLSIYFQRFNKDHSYSNSLEMLGQYYRLYADLMDHWKQTLDINFIELEYEKVIENPEEQMRYLLDKCNITWDPACLKFHENKRTVMTPSYDQVRRPIYTSSVAKWKKYEHLLGGLIESLGDRAN